MALLSERELDALHGAMTARNRLLALARKLPIAGLAYSALIEHGALRRLLDLDLTVEQRTEAIADLRSAVEAVLAKHPQEVVVVYLHAFYEMNEARWPNLKALLETEPRLQFAG